MSEAYRRSDDVVRILRTAWTKRYEFVEVSACRHAG